MKTRKGAVAGMGEDGRKRVSHRTPPKTAFANAGFWERDLSRSLPERMSNMLKNLEESQWITSYQLQYTGEEAACKTTTTSTCQDSPFSLSVQTWWVFFFNLLLIVMRVLQDWGQPTLQRWMTLVKR